MTSSFLVILQAILAGQDEIPGLPSDKLIASPYTGGDPVTDSVPQPVLLTLARLQTLLFQAREELGGTTSYEVVKGVAEVTNDTIAHTMVSQLQRDAGKNQRFLL